MLVVVFLLMLWEVFVHALHKHTPKSILPAVEYGLSEIGGLGFIGLLLELFRVHEMAGEEHSETLEVFQYLHIVFFKVAIGYFVYSAICVHGVMVQIQNTRAAERQENLPTNSTFTPSQLTLPSTTLWEELFYHGKDARSQEFLILRHRFLQKYQLPTDFHVAITPLLAHYLKELIHFSPFIWLPLVPIIAMGEAVDMTKGAANGASSNSDASVGYFYWQLSQCLS